MLPAWLLTGLGVALALPQLSSASVQGLPPDRYALGSAVNQTMRQLGATFGVALVVSFIAGATAGDALVPLPAGVVDGHRLRDADQRGRRRPPSPCPEGGGGRPCRRSAAVD